MTQNKKWSINLDKWTTDAGFSFESQAKEDFGIGFMYDISRGFSNGSFLLKMIKSLNNALDLDTKLEFDNFNGEDMYHQTVKAYLNNFQTELMWDVPKVYDYKDGKITFKFSGKKFNLDGHVDQIYDSILRQDSFDIDFVTELLPTYIPKLITLDAQTKNDCHFKSSIQYKEVMMRGGYFFKNQQNHKVF